MNSNLLSEREDISKQLARFGFDAEEINLLLVLLKSGPQSVAQLSKLLDQGRNIVYRLVDQLIEKQVVEQQLGSRGTVYAVKPAKQFKQLLLEKQAEVDTIEKKMPDLINQIESLRQTAPDSRVVYYEGIEGLKQVSYNITRAQDVVRVFEVEHLSEFIPSDYAEKLRQEYVDNKIHMRDLTNKPQMDDYTEVTELIQNYSELRYIDPKLLKIDFEVLIYNDVYATYTFTDEKIFCVEIYHQHLAQMQKQIFDFIWNQATPMKYISNKGSAKVIT